MSGFEKSFLNVNSLKFQELENVFCVNLSILIKRDISKQRFNVKTSQIQAKTLNEF